MKVILFFPAILQALATFFDEFIFHRRRGLPKWEIWGHPLDSLSVLVPFGYILLKSSTPDHIFVYIGMSAFSSLFVTKDEFVHTKKCVAQEHWLHSILFILHPISFLASGYLWYTSQGLWFLRFQFLTIFIFMIYQIMYWGKPWQFWKSEQTQINKKRA